MRDGPEPALVRVRLERNGKERRVPALRLKQEGPQMRVWVGGRIGARLLVPACNVSRARPLKGQNRVVYERLRAEYARYVALMRGLQPHSTGRDVRRGRTPGGRT
ncbi:MAG: hypothetical protein QN174_07595 [Armatimonadota bacterium]|nr:hypothetical protein [Armatimonadota bacterium]